ncbi:MAG: metallophosphoesterase [Cyanophyceae cyanobacterium]
MMRPDLNRRQVLRRLGLGGLALGGALLGMGRSRATLSHFSPGQAQGQTPLPWPEPRRGDLRIATISDLNGPYGSTTYRETVHRAIALLPSWRPDLVLCGGDCVAGQKLDLTRSQLDAMWAGFDRHIAAPLRTAGLPLAVTMGNHDASGSLTSDGQYRFASDRAAAAAYWQRTQGSLGLDWIDRRDFPFYYSLRLRDPSGRSVYILVWDASTARIPAAIAERADRDLASPAAQGAALRLVMGHMPFYPIAPGRDTPGNYLEGGDRWVSLLQRHRVSAYLSGHHHAYFPARVGSLDLLHLGNLGDGARPLLGSDRPPVQTLTLLDLFLDRGAIERTTYDLVNLTPLDERQLPAQIRSAPWTLHRHSQDAPARSPEGP